jgi:hypothetical protein
MRELPRDGKLDELLKIPRKSIEHAGSCKEG